LSSPPGEVAGTVDVTDDATDDVDDDDDDNDDGVAVFFLFLVFFLPDVGSTGAGKVGVLFGASTRTSSTDRIDRFSSRWLSG
jgi:hypothetical protein